MEKLLEKYNTSIKLKKDLERIQLVLETINASKRDYCIDRVEENHVCFCVIGNKIHVFVPERNEYTGLRLFNDWREAIKYGSEIMGSKYLEAVNKTLDFIETGELVFEEESDPGVPTAGDQVIRVGTVTPDYHVPQYGSGAKAAVYQRVAKATPNQKDVARIGSYQKVAILSNKQFSPIKGTSIPVHRKGKDITCIDGDIILTTDIAPIKNAMTLMELSEALKLRKRQAGQNSRIIRKYVNIMRRIGSKGIKEIIAQARLMRGRK